MSRHVLVVCYIPYPCSDSKCNNLSYCLLGSLEHSPSDNFRRKSQLAESGRTASVCDVQLKEDLAEAMKEDHGKFISVIFKGDSYYTGLLLS